MTVLCRSPKEHLVDAICYARMMCDKHPTRNFNDMLLAARAEHALADMCSQAALASCLDSQRVRVASPFDFVYHRFSGPSRAVDVKSKWSASDHNLSDHNDAAIDYVFLHPFDPSASVMHNLDLVFVIDGWTPGGPDGRLVQASPYLKAKWACLNPRSILDGFF